MTDTDISGVPTNALKLHYWRGKAIQAYASIEFSMSMLFSGLLESRIDVAGIVFFRMTNTSSRNAIFEKLITMRFGKKYEAYWSGIPNTPNRKGLFSLIRTLDNRRNEIVHWHTVSRLNTDDSANSDPFIDLAPPATWLSGDESSRLTPTDLREFSEMSDFVARSISVFAALTLRPDIPTNETWQRILQQPCTYPPPDTHPLSPNYKESETPTQSSPA